MGGELFNMSLSFWGRFDVSIGEGGGCSEEGGGWEGGCKSGSLLSSSLSGPDLVSVFFCFVFVL